MLTEAFSRVVSIYPVDYLSVPSNERTSEEEAIARPNRHREQLSYSFRFAVSQAHNHGYYPYKRDELLKIRNSWRELRAAKAWSTSG